VIGLNYERIGKFIAEKRKEKGLTQKQLALKLGVTDKAVSKWERGLGCPDVSILEILASELGVSILEILKGRIIENEVISVTEMNDYVEETLQFSNGLSILKFRNILSRILCFSIVFIGLFLLILNVYHVFYLHSRIEYNFDDKIIVDMKKNIVKIDNNIDKIKERNGIFSTEDYNSIIKLLDSSFEQYKNNPIFNYGGLKSLGFNDFQVLDSSIPSVLEVIEIYDILIKYDKSIISISDNYKNMFLLRGSLGVGIFNEIDYVYKYQSFDFFNDLGMDKYYLSVVGRIYNYKYLVDSYFDLTNLIMEVGGYNE